MAKQPAPEPSPKGKPQSADTAAKAAKPSKRPADAGDKGGEKAAGEKKRRRPVGVREELEAMKAEGGLVYMIKNSFRDSPAFAFSAVVHMIVVILLALVTLAPTIKQVAESLTGTVEETKEEELEEIQIDVPTEQIEVTEETQTFEMVESETIVDTPEISEMIDEAAPQLHVELDVGLETAPVTTLMNTTGRTTGTGISGRGAKMRSQLVAESGGSAGSEAAVGHALKWIAQHQLPNGAWNFDHGKAPKHQGPVNNPGEEVSETGAAGMALLCYLGAGQTHTEGDYKDTVKKGLYYLGSAMKVTPQGGDLRGGGNLYSHAIATIALCEGYALTQDKALAAPAQQAINFIMSAQDKTGGGWRYGPGQPGDTSVVGWHIQALKSGHLAYLHVEPRSVAGSINFLNLVQSDGGAFYGYMTPGKTPNLTAVGILCRMYLGWKKEEPALQKGVAYLMAQQQAQKNNMYYNYYATQVMRHFGGEEWTKWNAFMRDHLVNTQVTQGTYQQEKGSWTPAGKGHTETRGGRLCITCMACMTLEVYYRHLPLYKEAANQDDF